MIQERVRDGMDGGLRKFQTVNLTRFEDAL